MGKILFEHSELIVFRLLSLCDNKDRLNRSFKVSLLTSLLLDGGATYGDATAAAEGNNDDLALLGAENTLSQLSR